MTIHVVLILTVMGHIVLEDFVVVNLQSWIDLFYLLFHKQISTLHIYIYLEGNIFSKSWDVYSRKDKEKV